MPFNYKSPGIYVEEVDRGARPIESAATSVLGIVGLCRDKFPVLALRDPNDPTKGYQEDWKTTPADPRLITNWTEFTNTYGGPDQAVPGGYLHDAMYGYFLNGGTSAYVVGLPVPVEEKLETPTPLLTSGQDYLLNAAGQQTIRLITSPLKPDESVSVEVQPAEAGSPEGTFNLVVRHDGDEPRVVTSLSMTRGRGQRAIAEVLSRETEGLLTAEILEVAGNTLERLPVPGSKVTLTPAPQAAPSAEASASTKLKQKVTPDLFRGSAEERTGIAALESVDDVTVVVCPDIVAAYQWGAATAQDVKAVQLAILNHCEIMKDRFAILDSPSGLNTQGVLKWRMETMNFDSKYGALYYPWVKVDGKLMPPSGHVAGTYARVDSERGVHKAPANEQLRGVVELERVISRNDQDHLNPVGINCIRTFPGRGILIWGARTLSSDGQWRYINVRRLFSNIEESILQGTQWIVFEPNDDTLWRQIRRDVSSYLTTQWRSGALFGTTAEQAFYVKCDTETNPKELRDLGYCVIEVGLAPVKPAEFVVFRISQMRDGAGSANE